MCKCLASYLYTRHALNRHAGTAFIVITTCSLRAQVRNKILGTKVASVTSFWGAIVEG